MEDNTIDSLYRTSYRLVKGVKTAIHRYLYEEINWDNWLIAIKGARGVGKTTLILQHIKETFSKNLSQALYVSLDNMWFASHTLSEVVEYHYTHGGTHIFIDEIHKYPHWQTVIKNMTDEYQDLNIVYTGSSMLKMSANEGDLSRRQRTYTLQGLSFREFLLFEKGLQIERIKTEELLTSHVEIAMRLTEDVKILKLFADYLQHGYYPFYKREADGFRDRLQAVVKTFLYEDLPYVEPVTISTIRKSAQMLMILAKSIPQIPNMSELYSVLETNREQGMKIMGFLEDASLIHTLTSEKKRMRNLAKPDKLFLDNANLMYALAENTEIGTIRETFFLNQVSAVEEVTYPINGDFMVKGRWMFEVGGRRKSFEQIKDIDDSFLAIDDVEVGHGNKIPLWMFGMLY